MELIVISNPRYFEGEARLINALFEAGMSCLHLRKENSGSAELKPLLDLINPQFYERISLHQFHELASEYGIRRLHFPEQKRLEGAMLPFISSTEYTLSTSIHRIGHLSDLENFKYTFYGPVFDSISKKGYSRKVPADFHLLHSGSVKVIALGGIDVGKIELVKQMNFDGVAILGCLWETPEQAVKTFKELQEKCREQENL